MYKKLRLRFSKWWLKQEPMTQPVDYDLSVPVGEWPPEWHLKRALELFERSKTIVKDYELLMTYHNADFDSNNMRVLREKKHDIQQEALFHLQMGQGMKEGWYSS